MRSFTGMLLVVLIVASLCGCTGAFSGVTGSTLIRTGYPRVSLTANEPLALYGYGRQWVTFVTEYLGQDVSGSMDYAVYAAEKEGPVTRHAHAFIVKPNNERLWYFGPESYKAPGGLILERREINGYIWNVQIIRVVAENDWFSAMWKENGRIVPEVWIARRFSATPDKVTRVVAEYREPWPACLNPEAEDLVFVCKECLEDFFARSDAAFNLEIHRAEPLRKEPAPTILVKPKMQPDMRKLAGDLLKEDFSFRSWH